MSHFHFIGIGGIGMCGLAEILLGQGHQVSGSDVQATGITRRLGGLGATIHQHHQASNLGQADIVVYSSAVTADNPELKAANEQGLSILHRGQLLAQLMSNGRGIAIAGSHGKTTTTGLIGHVLAATRLDPTTINGGMMQGGSSTVHIGKSDLLVAEADESDASFLRLQPNIAVITNVEADHLECYQHDFARLQQSFIEFINKLPEDGLLVCCIDDPVIRAWLPQCQVPVITYGFSADADIRASQFQQQGLESVFYCQGRGLTDDKPWQLALPGKHNVQNALAAIALAQHFKIDEAVSRKQLATFPGIGRRFHACGEFNLPVGKAMVFTDYGHHPSEISATITAARAAWPKQRLLMVFQPHRYSRTQALLDEFVQALSQVDVLLLTDIYSAGEAAIAGVSGDALYQACKQQHNNVHYVPVLEQLPATLAQYAQDQDVVFLQGAGTIGTQAIRLLDLTER